MGLKTSPGLATASEGNPPPSRGEATTSVARTQGHGEDGGAAEPGQQPEWVGRALEEARAAVHVLGQRWQEQREIPALARLGQVLAALVSAVVQGGIAEGEALSSGNGRAVAQAAQRAVQPVGRAYVQEAWRLAGHADVPPPEQRPCCVHCGRRMKLVAACRLRHLQGRFGSYALGRPYYTCEHFGGGCAPADGVWGLGAGLLDPDLAEVVTGDGVRESFEAARQSGRRHLQVDVDDNEAQRATEAMGLVAMRQTEQRASAGTCRLAGDPGSDILLLEVDGGRVDAGGAWRETKVAAAGPLGPEVQVDPDTGRVRLCTGPLGYAADIATAEQFFDREVRQLAEDAGLFHPRVRSVVLLSDGGEWIENRWSSLGLPERVTVFDILDVRHFEEHVWTAAKACWGERSPRTKAGR